MFSRKTMVIVVIILGVSINFIILFFAMRRPVTAYGAERMAFPIIAPFQNITAETLRQFQRIWSHYFFLVSVAEENERLKAELEKKPDLENRCVELELANRRFRNLLDFKDSGNYEFVAAEVIGKDASPWNRSITVNKGMLDGLGKSMPVVISEGAVGVITHVSDSYAKVQLLIDRSSAVDGMIQRNRARGMVKGDRPDSFRFEYVLRRHDVRIGDTVITSGMDGIFPKGLPVGRVETASHAENGIFQQIQMIPSVDFETLEEVLVFIPPAAPGL